MTRRDPRPYAAFAAGVVPLAAPLLTAGLDDLKDFRSNVLIRTVVSVVIGIVAYSAIDSVTARAHRATTMWDGSKET